MTTFRKNGGGHMPPLPSTADRNVAVSSRGHFNGHVVVGDGSGRGTPLAGGHPRVVQIESHLELSWCLCLEARPDIVDLREQIAFDWRDSDRPRTHFFDFVITRTDGTRVACMVRPEARVRGKFAAEMGLVASQARASGFVSDVRLLTDSDLDPVDLANAKATHGFRTPEARADGVAAEVIRAMTGPLALGELIGRTGLGADGFGALLRFLRCHTLALVRHERISRDALVYKKETV